MKFVARTYIPGSSAVHNADARVKVLVLIAYSASLFLTITWQGMSALLLLLAGVVGLSRVPLSRFLRLGIPLFVLLGFTVACNAFSFDPKASASFYKASGIAGLGWENVETVVVFGSLQFAPAGLLYGAFVSLRILLLFAANFVVCFTATETELTDALSWMLRPLSVIRFPAEDAATLFSLVLRFIPVTAEELGRVRDAQASRGAPFEGSGLWAALKSWTAVFVPLLVGMFRRADSVSDAMKARCYGKPQIAKTHLRERKFSAKLLMEAMVASGTCLLVGIVL